MHNKVLITGITGFLGAHIAAWMLDHGLQVAGIIRSQSDTWRCREFAGKVRWIVCDQPGWKEQAVAFAPSVIVHAAWEGISAADRNNLAAQTVNLKLLAEILDIARDCHAGKVIGLGSQAEYGRLDHIVTEDAGLHPENAYGMVKVLAARLIEQFCTLHQIEWLWLRLFSFFGEKEAANWLMPTVIKALINNQETLALSSGMQKYAYMYVGDMAALIGKMAIAADGRSGIYNISFEEAQPLKDIIERIKIISGNKYTRLDFGAVPSRPGQSMWIQGDMSKFKLHYGEPEFTSMDDAIAKTISYFKLVSK